MWYNYKLYGYLTMERVKYSTLRVDYMQLSLKAVSYFILNFEDMVLYKDSYIFDLNVTIEGKSLTVCVKYRPLSGNAKSSFWFDVESNDADLNIIFSGCFDVACSCAADIAEEYMRRVGK